MVVHCGWFDQSLIAALHERGDCYVSLHRGEGWGYPLFEAVSRGKPAVATGYGGPVDYLNERYHWIVRHCVSFVRRPYFLYDAAMKWAEPDINHAAEGLRWSYEHQAEVRAGAQRAALPISRLYSVRRIGEMALRRLMSIVVQYRK